MILVTESTNFITAYSKLTTAENILATAEIKQREIANAKENAHFVFCPTLLPEKIQKEHFPSLFLPSLKKE